MQNPWRALEGVRGLAGVTASWRRWAGEDVIWMQEAFLRKKATLATLHPCPNECGCAHAVVTNNADGCVAVCQCEPWNCKDFRVTEDDLAVWGFKFPKFGRCVARAFGIQESVRPVGVHQARQIGNHGKDAAPVLVLIQHDEESAETAIQELLLNVGGRFILLLPTRQFLNAKILGLLERSGRRCLDLESELTIQPDGALLARRGMSEAFPKSGLAVDPLNERVENPAPLYSFTRSGSVWKVVFEGRPEFHLRDSLDHAA